MVMIVCIGVLRLSPLRACVFVAASEAGISKNEAIDDSCGNIENLPRGLDVQLSPEP